MAMNESLAIGLLEATRLTRAGRLAEATAAIQRALGQKPVSKPKPRARPEAPEIPEGRAGQFIAGSYAHPQGTRPYKLYIPTSYAAGKSLPLVVMLHGCTQNPDDFAAGTRMNAIAEERQCFVLYPAQTKSANGSRCWNWFKRAHQRRDKGEPAILAGMTQEVVQRHGIDAGKVYVAGLSAGGAMAAVMGAAYPDVYAAIGVHSGLPVGSAHDVQSAFAAMRGAQSSSGAAAGRVVPAIVFHGDRDATVHPRNGRQVASQCVDRHDESLDVVVQRGQVPGGHAYTCSVHKDAAGRTVLEHWEVHGAGHAWFGGSPRGSYTDPNGPEAAREMMRFFGLS
ncbi:MAG TPA: PHB depolymerase family esterase [Burkholderiales bacterium]|nr:PHB depolymerase family esterase [Burkholderiales bacterium]